MTDTGSTRRSIRLVVPDRPGALAEITAILADAAIDIVRLEVWPGTDEVVYDDLTLETPTPGRIDGAVRELRAHGYETVTLPEHWWLRDWANEVFEAIEALEGARTRSEELDAVLDAAARLANVSHAAVVSAPAGGRRVGHRVDRLAGAFEPAWIRWGGELRAVATVEQTMRDVTEGIASTLEPVDAVHGLAVEIPGPTAASAVLAVVGVRPPFVAAEVARIQRYASLVGRLHPVEPVLAAPLR
jgi:hypothetical protein